MLAAFAHLGKSGPAPLAYASIPYANNAYAAHSYGYAASPYAYGNYYSYFPFPLQPDTAASERNINEEVADLNNQHLETPDANALYPKVEISPSPTLERRYNTRY